MPHSRILLKMILAVIFISSVILLFSSQGGSEVGGPVAGMTSPTGWVIESGDSASYSEETILLNGDLIIQSGGELTFDGVDMYSNARGDKNATIRILVEEGGTFIVRDSLLSSRYHVDEYQGNQPWRYKFHVEGGLNMTGTTVEYMWGDLEGIIIPDVVGNMHSTNTGGVEIWSDDVFIQDCVLTRSQTCGMNIWEGSPTILDTEFVENDMMGMSVLDGESAAWITGCSFSNNGGNGVTLHANFLDFRDNVLHDNGGNGFFIINSQNVTFEDLESSGNLRGLHVVLCDATFVNCSIVDNQVTMAVTNEGSVVLENCEIDMVGGEFDLHDGCWVAECISVEITVNNADGPVKGARVTMSGTEGNLTWTHESKTDSQGKAMAFPALLVRFNDWWHNFTTYSVIAEKDTRSAVVNMTLDDADDGILIELDGGNGDDPDPGGDDDPADVEDGGDDDDDLYLPLGIGLIVVLVVVGVILFMKRRAGEDRDPDDFGEGWDDELNVDRNDH